VFFIPSSTASVVEKRLVDSLHESFLAFLSTAPFSAARTMSGRAMVKRCGPRDLAAIRGPLESDRCGMWLLNCNSSPFDVPF